MFLWVCNRSESAGDHEEPAGVEAADSAPGGRDEEVASAVAVHVAESYRVEPERVAWDSACIRFQQPTVVGLTQRKGSLA